MRNVIRFLLLSLTLFNSREINACNNNRDFTSCNQQASTNNDTISYHYNFDTSESTKANLYEGWIDTFTISNRQFRLKYAENTDSINIEYNLGGKWIKNTSLVIRDDFEKNFDSNHDGYGDIYSQSQGWNFVNYYLPSKKLFSKQYKQPGDGEEVIDSANKLYANYREPYHACNNYVSQLVDYKNTVPVIHYTLEGYTDCNIDNIKTIKLYRYNSNKNKLILKQTIKPKNPKDFPYFEFWQAHYKRLLKDEAHK